MAIHTSDSDEIAASQADSERFAVIFDRHYVAIRNFLRRRISSSLADELAAETFVVAFRRRATYDHVHANARPWLFGIAVNLLRRHRRQENRELRANARTAMNPFQSAVEGEDPQHSHDRRIGAELTQALASLAAKDREVLFLYAVADLSYEEISRALEVPIGTVRSRLSRARRHIRELLDDQRAIQGEGIIHPEGN